MTRIMYDSTAASDIPTSAAMVAGYIDGQFAWSTADWARFPSAVKVQITVFGADAGHVLDVELGDATPAQAVTWVRARRQAGADPTVYCNLNTFPSVVAAFNSAGVSQPHFWVAQYDNNAILPSGWVAKQYTDSPASGGHFDLSVVADYWPGVDPTSGDFLATVNQGDWDALIWRVEAILNNRPTVLDGPTKGEINQLHTALTTITPNVLAGTADVTVTLTPGK